MFYTKGYLADHLHCHDWGGVSRYHVLTITINKYSLLMHCIISPAKSVLNEQYVIVGGNIYFLCVLSCSSEEAWST